MKDKRHSRTAIRTCRRLSYLTSVDILHTFRGFFFVFLCVCVCVCLFFTSFSGHDDNVPQWYACTATAFRVRERERETDRQTDRQRQRDRDRLFGGHSSYISWVFFLCVWVCVCVCLFVCLFFTSFSGHDDNVPQWYACTATAFRVRERERQTDRQTDRDRETETDY